jgi:hypothetical protein
MSAPVLQILAYRDSEGREPFQTAQRNANSETLQPRTNVGLTSKRAANTEEKRA